jgi:hypothetical protein
MSAGIWFWILYVLCLFVGLFFNWPGERNGWRPIGWTFAAFVLIGLLGWTVYGPPVR